MSATLLHGDARSVLRRLPEGTAQVCVTSPPYYGLRDYGLPPLVWGGDSLCDHQWSTSIRPGISGGTASEKVQIKGRDNFQIVPPSTNATCVCCGAWQGCLGLEPSPELYVAHLVDVLREVGRVLADDGTLWLNLGDSYAGNRGNSAEKPGYDNKAAEGHATFHFKGVGVPNGLKEKDLIGVPWMVAFALRADGWYLRSDVIWSKPNCMPESVTDRPTRSHEYLFLFSKSALYYYDTDAIKEPIVSPHTTGRYNHRGQEAYQVASGMGVQPQLFSRKADPSGRNRRSVWTINTKPFKGAHFAVFPPALVEPCILAGSEEGDLVLDPFCGSGTTGVVAQQHGRDFLGIDLSEKYLALARERLAAGR